MMASNSDDERSTEGMVDYNKNSAMQQQLVNHHAGRLQELTKRLGRIEPELRLVDYGCGPGQSAIEAVEPSIAAYRSTHADAAISVCHADQPGNDWNGLFGLVNGPSGYASSGIRTGAAVGSFYDQMVAEDSVDLGTCFMASHWLSHAVHLNAPSSVWFADLKGAARAELAAVARHDWVRFLRRRSRELRRGGFLLVSHLGAVADDREINGIAASGHGTYRAIQAVAQDMATDGLIDQRALDGFVFGVWFPTEQEAREPLEEDPELKEAFEIEEVSVLPAPRNPTDVYADFIGDPGEYARLYVGYIRGFGHSTLNAQLFEPSATADRDAQSLADEFYRRLDELYQKHPGQYPGQNWYLTVVLRRQ